MESFDSPGMQIIENPIITNRRLTYYEKHFMEKETNKKDHFKLLNSTNVSVEHHLRANLDRK